MLTEQEERELLAQDDGRLQFLYKHKDGTMSAHFNTSPYQSVPLTQQQWDKYVVQCTPHHKYCVRTLLEMWACAEYDNGLPKWFNKIFS